MTDSSIYCDCGCGGIVRPGRRYIFQHHHRGKSPSSESNEKRRLTQLGRKWSEFHKKTRKAHKEGCNCFPCKAKRGELKGVNCPNTGRNLSLEHREKISIGGKLRGGHNQDCKCPFCKAKNGEHPNWHGGISKHGYPYTFNDKLKNHIRERDGYVCQLCSKPQEENKRKLDIHHIDYNKDNLDLNNLITLCRNCNGRVNKNREYWTKYFLLKWMLVA